MRGFPLRFESLARNTEHLLLGRIIDEDIAALGIDSHHDSIMKRPVRAASLQADDQRPSLLQMMAQITPLSTKREGAIAGFLKIRLHAARGYAALLWREQGCLDLFRIREIRKRLSVSIDPILKHHGYGGRTAAISYLWNEWDIDPNSRGFRGGQMRHTHSENQQRNGNDAEFHEFSERRQ